MPYIKIQTNSSHETAQGESLLQKLSSTTAECLGKPERYVMVALETNTPMCFAGDKQPTAYLELKSIGLPEEATKTLSKAISQVVMDELNIPAERIYIEFANAERHMWGWNQGTF